MLEVAHASAAQLFFHRDSQQSHRAQLQPEVRGEAVRAVDLRRPRGDFRRGKTGDLLAQPVHCLDQAEIEGRHGSQVIAIPGLEQRRAGLGAAYTGTCAPATATAVMLTMPRTETEGVRIW